MLGAPSFLSSFLCLSYCTKSQRHLENKGKADMPDCPKSSSATLALLPRTQSWEMALNPLYLLVSHHIFPILLHRTFCLPPLLPLHFHCTATTSVSLSCFFPGLLMCLIFPLASASFSDNPHLYPRTQSISWAATTDRPS